MSEFNYQGSCKCDFYFVFFIIIIFSSFLCIEFWYWVMGKGDGHFDIYLSGKQTINDKFVVCSSIAAKAFVKKLCLLSLFVFIYLLIHIRNRCIFISSVSVTNIIKWETRGNRECSWIRNALIFTFAPRIIIVVVFLQSNDEIYKLVNINNT